MDFMEDGSAVVDIAEQTVFYLCTVYYKNNI